MARAGHAATVRSLRARCVDVLNATYRSHRYGRHDGDDQQRQVDRTGQEPLASDSHGVRRSRRSSIARSIRFRYLFTSIDGSRPR